MLREHHSRVLRTAHILSPIIANEFKWAIITKKVEEEPVKDLATPDTVVWDVWRVQDILYENKQAPFMPSKHVADKSF